jgi:hypothetical protein
MTTPIGTLQYSRDDPAVEIHNARELDDWLDKLTHSCDKEYPAIFRLYTHGYQVEIGLGLPESFVQMEHESGLPPYFLTLGDTAAEGDVSFYLFGDHHVKFPRRHLIPIDLARRVVHVFFETGERSEAVGWEKLRE